ncbi:MAG TPA: M48 family metalloprotease [Candidatus Binatia bacterium]|jgi:predicted Zn-dependent protease
MRRLLAILLAALVALPSFVVTPAFAQIAEERKMGDEFVGEAIAHMPLIHDYELAGFLRELGGKLVATLGQQPFEYEFFVVQDDDINAFSVPGGKLFANAGLISRVDSEDALAGVIGHEIGHAAAHHLVRQQQKGAAANYASLLGLLLGIINPALAIGSLAAGQAAQLSYQRDFEREADYLGIEYARKAGYDPSAMMSLLRELGAEEALNPTKIPPYVLTHPMSTERLTNLEAVLGRHEWDPSKATASWRLRRAQAIARAYSQSRDQCVPEYERKLEAATPAQRPEYLELIGILMSHGEEYDSAEKYLKEAESSGRNVDRELGRAEYHLGHFDEARTRLNRVIEKTPQDWDTLADLASIDAQEGNYAAASIKLKKSVELEPYRANVLLAYARSLGKSGHEDQGMYWMGRTSEAQGASRQAIEYYKKSLEKLAKDDPLRDDIKKRTDKLGEHIIKDNAEQGGGPGAPGGPAGGPVGGSVPH